MDTTTFTLTPEDRFQLEHVIQAYGNDGLTVAKRASILLGLDQGRKRNDMVKELGITNATVANVKKRYLAQGVASVYAGTNISYRTSKQTILNALRDILDSPPPEGKTHWSLRNIAREMVAQDIVDSISYTSISKYLDQLEKEKENERHS